MGELTWRKVEHVRLAEFVENVGAFVSELMCGTVGVHVTSTLLLPPPSGHNRN